MLKRMISMILCMAMVLSMLPAPALAEETAEQTEPVIAETTVPNTEPPETTVPGTEPTEPAAPETTAATDPAAEATTAPTGPDPTEESTVPETSEEIVEETEETVEEILGDIAGSFDAASGTCGTSVRWTLSDTGKLSITGSGNMGYFSETTMPWYDYREQIVSVSIGSGVTSVGGYAFYGFTALTSVTIGSSVKTIDTCAFQGCTGLKSITIPTSVKTIGTSSFDGCTGLTSITIPSSVTMVSSYAFSRCTGLTKVSIPSSLGTLYSGIFEGCTSLKEVTVPSGITEMGYTVFQDCTSLTKVTLPESLTTIGSSVFSGCSSLETVNIPTGLTELSTNLFRDCAKLTSIVIPSGVTKIDSGCFQRCTGLTKLPIPSKVTEIGAWAFDGCTGLTSITIPSGVTQVSLWLFRGCTNLTSVSLPDGITTIAKSAFEDCTSLSDITLPDTVTTIGDYAFQSCESLKSIVIPSKVTQISNNVFSNCTALTSVTLHDAITSIGADSFYRCTALTGITIPDSVATIGSYAFSRCTSLAEVTLPSGLTALDKYTFDNCSSLKAISLPDSLTSIGNSAFYKCTALTSITIPEKVTSIGGSAFFGCSGLTALSIPQNITTIERNTFNGCSSLTSVNIPAGVTSIGQSAFYGCSSLTSLSIPQNITAIANYSFQNCSSLRSITIPAGVTSIGDSAFAGCSGLTEIHVPQTVTEIGFGAFSGCSSLTSVTLTGSVSTIMQNTFNNCSNLIYILLPDSVTSIEHSAFQNCYQLTAVGLPASLTSVNTSAFHNCNNLQHVLYKGTEEQRAATNFASGSNSRLDNASWCYGSAEDTLVASDNDNCLALAQCRCTACDSTLFTARTEAAHTYENGICTVCAMPEGVVCSVSKSTVTIKDYTSSASKLVLPEKVGEMPVTAIDSSAFSYCNTLKDITIPSGVTSIGNYAFNRCSALKSVRFTGDAPSFGFSCFYDVTTSIYFPLNNATWSADVMKNYGGTLQWLGRCDAAGHTAVTDEKVAPTCTNTGLTEGSHCSVCGQILVAQETVPATGHTPVTDPAVDATCTETGLGEGSHCDVCDDVLKAQTVVPALGHTPVTDAAVDATCTEDGLTEGSHCDVCGEVLTAQEVVPAKHVISNGSCTRCGSKGGTCGSKLTWTLDDIGTLTIYGSGAMADYSYSSYDGCGPWYDYADSITSLVLPEGLTYIGAYAFYLCKNLTSVEIPSTVTAIGNSAFSNTGLTTVSIPGTVKTIGESAFFGCYELQEVILEEGVTTIGSYAFASGVFPTHYVIPSSVTEISLYALSGGGTVTYNGTMAQWSSLYNHAIFVTCTDGVFNGSGSCGSSANWYMDADGVLTITGSGSLIDRWSGDSAKRITGIYISPDITYIPGGAFYGASNLTHITLPIVNFASTVDGHSLGGIFGSYSYEGSVAVVQSYHPSGSNHTSLSKTFYIPASLKSVTINNVTKWFYTFENCSMLETITFGEKVTSIPKFQFWGCRNVKTLVFLGNAPTFDKENTNYYGSLYGLSATAYYPKNNSTWTSSVTSGNYSGAIVWKEMACTGGIDHIPGTPVKEGETAPSCKTNGSYKLVTYCTACSEKISTETIPIPSTGHTPVTDAAVTPDCNNTGLTEGSHCSVCGETIVAQETVGALGHTSVTDAAVAPDCNNTGLTEGSHCSVCGDTITAQKIVPALGHTTATLKAVKPTCTQTGLTEGSYCSVCNTTLVEQQVVSAAGHSPVTDAYAAPTCTETGLTEGSHCGTCGETLTAQQTIGATGHSPVTDASVAPSCTETGLTEGSHCGTCGETLVAQNTVDKLGHREQIDPAVKATCTTDGLTEGSHCSVCQDVLVKQNIIAAAHYFENDVCIYCNIIGGYITDSYNTSNTLCWTLSTDGTLTIRGPGYIPDGEHFADYTGRIKSLVIEEGVTSIGGWNFKNCIALTSITFPSTLYDIGFHSFHGCTGLKSVVFPDNIQYISSSAFYECTSLTDISFWHESDDYLYIHDSAFGLDSTKLDTYVHVPYTNSINSGITGNSVAWHGRTLMFRGMIPVPATSIELSTEGNVTEIEAGLPLTLHANVIPSHTTSEMLWTVTGNAYWNGYYGTVTGTAPGTVTLRCASADDPSIYDEITITILEPAGAIESLSVYCGNEYGDELEVGTSVQMYADIQPGNAVDKRVTWSVENGTGSATISETGELTGVTPGTVTVYATSVANNDIVGSRVVEIMQYVDSITILLNGKKNVTTIGLSETIILSAEVSPSDASYPEPIWTVDCGTGEALIKYDPQWGWDIPELRTSAAGTITLTATARDSHKAIARVTLNIVGEIASYPVIGGNIYYNTATGVITDADDTVTDANIPPQIGGTVITGIAPYAFAMRDSYVGIVNDNTTLQSVTIPSTVTWIGDHAFAQCRSLAGVKINGSGLTTIGESAFYYCQSLASIELPESVTTIEKNAYSGCNSVTSLVIPEGLVSIGKNAFCLSNLNTLTIPGDLNCLEWLQYNHTLESLTLTGTKVIAMRSRYYSYSTARNAKSITIADTVTTVEAGAFSGCDSFTQITLPASVHSIGDEAFMACYNLANVRIKGSLTSIGARAFADCNNLREICMESTVVSIASQAFRGMQLDKITFLGNAPTSIAADAFAGTIANAYYPLGNTTWSYSIMQQYGGQITWNFMLMCVQHTPAVLAALAPTCTETGLTEGSSCSSCGMVLTAQQTIPVLGHDYQIDVVAPGCETFGYTCHTCVREDSVLVTDKIPATGHREVTDAAVEPTCTKTGLTEGSHCENCGEVYTAQAEVPALGHRYVDHICTICRDDELTEEGIFGDNLIWILDKTTGTLNIYGIGEMPDLSEDAPWETWKQEIKTVNVLDGVTSIGHYAFEGMTNLAHISAPDTLQWIGEAAFGSCSSLEIIPIPEGVTSISSSAFAGCTALTEVIFLGDAPELSEEFFLGVTATAYYPGTNGTWNADTLLSYGGHITWKAVYDILSGEESLVKPGESLEIRIDGDIGEFEGAYVDDSLVDPSCYTVASGSTIVTFLPAYLDTLAEGIHTARFQFARGGTETVFTIAPRPAAAIGTVQYETVSDAVSAAAKGQTITVLKDTAEEMLYLRNDKIIDLNGHALTVGLFIGVNGTHLIDSSAGNTGILIADADAVQLSVSNGQFPVYTGTGYVFTEVRQYNHMLSNTSDGKNTQYVTQPMFEPFVHPYLGTSTDAVDVAVRVSWDFGTGISNQDYVYFDTQIRNVTSSYKPSTGKYGRAYSAVLKGIINTDTHALSGVLISATGAEVRAVDVTALIDRR